MSYNFGVSYNCWVMPDVAKNVYDEVGAAQAVGLCCSFLAAEHEGNHITFVGNDYNSLVKRIEEDDDLMVLTTSHPFMGAKVDDEISGGVVLAVLIDKDECECPEDARAWAVIFSDPYVGGPEVIK